MGKSPADDNSVALPVPQKRKRGSKSCSGELNCTATPAEISQIVADSYAASKHPHVKSDEECEARIEQYFNWCVHREKFPLWEELCLFLGTARNHVWEWANGIGCSADRTRMIKSAREVCASVDARLAQQGKIQPVVYIFRAKNFFGMRDHTEVTINPANAMGPLESRKELEEKLSDVVIDPDEIEQ